MKVYALVGIISFALVLAVALLIGLLTMPMDTEPVVTSISDNCTMAYGYYHDVLLKYDYIVKQDRNGLVNLSDNPSGSYDIGTNRWWSNYSGLHKTK